MLPIKPIAPVCAMLLLAACAASPTPDYGTDHPANPAAAAGAIPQSTAPALASYRDAPPAPPTPTGDQEDPHAHHH